MTKLNQVKNLARQGDVPYGDVEQVMILSRVLTEGEFESPHLDGNTLLNSPEMLNT